MSNIKKLQNSRTLYVAGRVLANMKGMSKDQKKAVLAFAAECIENDDEEAIPANTFPVINPLGAAPLMAQNPIPAGANNVVG